MTMPKGWDNPEKLTKIKPPYTADAIEQRKWMFGCIQTDITNRYNAIESIKETVTSRMHQAYPDEIKNSRNTRIGWIAFAITTLLSLNGLINIELSELVQIQLSEFILILVIVLSLVAILIYYYKTKEWERLFIISSQMGAAYNFAQQRLLGLGMHISKMSMHPESYTTEDLDELFEFVYFVDSNRIELVEALKKAKADPKVFEKDKHLLDSLLEPAEKRMRLVSSSYKHRFDSQNALIKNMYHSVEKMVNDYS